MNFLLLAENAEVAVIKATTCRLYQQMGMEALHVLNLDDADLPRYLSSDES